jgi:hypothetical protein
MGDTKRHITLRLDERALDAASLIAKAEGRSRNDVLRRLIHDGLGRREAIPCSRCGRLRPVNAYCPCAPSLDSSPVVVGRTPWTPATPHRPGDPLPEPDGEYVRGPVEEGA